MRMFKISMRNLTVARSRLGLTSQHLTMNRCSSTVSSVSIGSKYSTDYQKFATVDGKVVSYFHDIPLSLDLEAKEANMVVEIPRWTNAKFEISHGEGNPIQQDAKKGKVRFVKNLFPHHGYIHNYGAFPQTWEDPTEKHTELDLYGDNDPLDVCDIGSVVLLTGDIKRVKILGSIALIDDGELDWKVIVINKDDPLSEELFDIHDVFTKCPGLLETTRQWFKDYKLPDGKPTNKFAYNGVYKNQEETLKIIQECSESWKKLISGKVSGEKLPLIANTSIKGSPGYTEEFAQTLYAGEAQAETPIPSEIDKSYFLSTD